MKNDTRLYVLVGTIFLTDKRTKVFHHKVSCKGETIFCNRSGSDDYETLQG